MVPSAMATTRASRSVGASNIRRGRGCGTAMIRHGLRAPACAAARKSEGPAGPESQGEGNYDRGGPAGLNGKAVGDFFAAFFVARLAAAGFFAGAVALVV